MPLHSAVAHLTKSYVMRGDDPWAQTEIVNHRGTLIAVAQTQGGQFYYAILSLDEAAGDGASDADAWSTNPLPLPFPVESVAAGAEAVSLVQQPVFTKDKKPPREGQFVRTVDRHPYLATTACLSEPGVPFNLVSDGIYLCLFRPSKAAAGAPATLLMDRYNFDGKALSLKLETRYQRSRLKGIPLNRKDTLGFEDLDKNPFHEPTHGLQHLVGPVSGGHFAVVLVPSLIPDEQNWQFFTWEDGTASSIHCTSIPRGKDGLFDAQARSYYVSADPLRHPEVFSQHPGNDPDGNPLIPWNGHGGKQRFSFKLPGNEPSCYGLHAAVYARQAIPALEPGANQGYSPVAKPMLGEQRLLLAVASRHSDGPEVNPNFVTLDFGVSRDGRLVNAARERLIELEQNAPQQVHDLPDADKAMDIMVAALATLGGADDATVYQASANQLKRLHAQRETNQKALAALKRCENIKNEYEQRYRGNTSHKVALFKDKDPQPDQLADCTLEYRFPVFTGLFDDQGNTIKPPAPTHCRLADPAYRFNDTASAARIESDVLVVEFYRHYGGKDRAPEDLMFTKDKRETIKLFSEMDASFNDALSGVVIKPHGALQTQLQAYLASKEDLDSARKLLIQLSGAHPPTMMEPGEEIARIKAAIADLDAKIIAAQQQGTADVEPVMQSCARYPLQQSGIDGAITAFAWSEHPPRLVRHGDGRVAMYYRGVAGQCFVASLDTTVNGNGMRTPAWRGGRPGKALALSGAGLKTGFTEAVTSSDRLTIEAWFRPAELTRAWLFSHGDYAIRFEPGPAPGQRLGLHYDIHGKQGKVAPNIPLDTWTHAAFVYRRAYGLHFSGNDHVDCGNAKTLDVIRDLTIELCLTADTGPGSPQTLLHKGDSSNAGEVIAYALVLDKDMRLRWRYGASLPGGSTSNAELDTGIQLQPGVPARIAVVREYVVDQALLSAELEKKKQNPAYTMDMRFAAFAHLFYLEGVLKNSAPRADGTPTGGDGAFVLGANAEHEEGFRGTVAELRVWNKALDAADLHRHITDKRSGVVSWWRLDEREGPTAEDLKSGNHGSIVGARWVPDPDPRASTLVVYVNGQRMHATPLAESLAPPSSQPLVIGGSLGNDDAFCGELEEIRLWACERSQTQIRDHLFRSLDEDRDGLLAYIDGEVVCTQNGGVELEDQSGNGVRVPVTLAQLNYSTAPIGLDAPVLRPARQGIETPFACTIQSPASAAEYGAMQADAQGNGMGVLKRAYAFISEGRWHLLTGFKVGSLALEWIGQAQFDPQVVGFIEGAPPVPSENLSFEEQDNYDGAASVQINEAKSTLHAIGSSSEKTAHMAIDMMRGLGVESESEVGLGAATTVEKVEISAGVRFSHENTTTTGTETQIGMGGTLDLTSAMSLTGYWESGAGQYPMAGKRYVPQNMALAVVQSETVDVFALRMSSSGLMVSRAIRKNPDIPRDWNIIMFPINPRYTKQGTLDGKIGLETDVDYPASLDYSPDSSYFKPLEAYRWKRTIEQQAQVEREKYLQFGTQAQGGLPRLHQRSIANTYVWTAEGGFFAESTQTIDSMEQASTGSLSWDISAGVSTDFKVIVSKAGPVGNFELMAGGGVTTTTMAASSSETGFSLEVELDLETDIYERDALDQVLLNQGTPKKKAGKVDAYRFMSFYLAPDNTHLLELKKRVVDPNWLESDDMNARAMKSALASTEARPWRIMHRVTFVSRVHGAPGTSRPSSDEKLTLDETMINSNYELIQILQPHIKGSPLNYATFEQQVREAVTSTLPSYAAKVDDIVKLAGAYYGIFPEDAASAAHLSAGSAAPIQHGA